MPSQNPESTIRRAIYWTVSAFFLALAIQANYGRYSPLGMACLSLAILAALAGAFFPVLPVWVSASQRTLNIVLGAGATFFAMYWMLPTTSPHTLSNYAITLAFCAFGAVILARLTNIPIIKCGLFPALLLFHLVTGISTVIKVHAQEQRPQHAPYHVRNDVQVFAEQAAAALNKGQNPYSLRMPNVMGADMPYYSEGTTGPDGRLSFGYPYLPLTALWSLPAYWLGDFRYSHLFAVLAAAVLLAYARPSTTSQLAAIFFLFFPPAMFVLMMSWIEPVVVFFLAATVFSYYRAPRWLFLTMGCLIAAKQYTVFLLPLLPLLFPEKEKWRPLLWQSVGVAMVLSLPMALWDVSGFYRSVVEIQFKQPFRTDSLSYLVTVLKLTGMKLSPLFGFLALLGGLWMGTRKAPPTASGWCAAAAVAYLGFFALNKQAFANYYFWPFALLVAAVAIALPPQPTPMRGGLESKV